MHMWNFKCSSKGNMSGAVVGDDDNHKQTTTSRHSKTFINHEHLLNRSPMLFCASDSTPHLACKVSQWQLCNELWTLKTETECERERRRRRNSAARCFQSNRLARLLFFCFFLSFLRDSREIWRFSDVRLTNYFVVACTCVHTFGDESHELF